MHNVRAILPDETGADLVRKTQAYGEDFAKVMLEVDRDLAAGTLKHIRARHRDYSLPCDLPRVVPSFVNLFFVLTFKF